MIEASSNLNSFGLAGHVSPSEQLITLTLGQLQDLVQEATERATAPLEAQAVQARLAALEEGVRCREGEEPANEGAGAQAYVHLNQTMNLGSSRR